MGIEDLLPLAGRLVERANFDDPMPVFCLDQEQIDQMESPTSLKQLLVQIRTPMRTTRDSLQLKYVHIVWIEAALRNPAGIDADANTHQHAKEIELWACETILPTSSFAKQSPFDPSMSVL
jgi:hypothetical protein